MGFVNFIQERIFRSISGIKELFYPVNTIFLTMKKVDKINHENILKAKHEKKNVTILLHGMADNYYRSMYWIIKLFEKNDMPVYSFDFDYREDIRVVSKRLDKVITKIREETGVRQINLIGICLGGLIGRYYSEKFGGKNHINKLVTIFSPYRPVDNWVMIYLSLLGVNKELLNSYAEEIMDKFNVKNHLALYSAHDFITGSQYPIPKKFALNIKQKRINSSHLFISSNFQVIKEATEFIKGEKIVY